MPEFLAPFGTEAQRHGTIVAMRRPDDLVRPICQGTKYGRIDRDGPTYRQCSACRRKTKAIFATRLQNTCLPLTHWLFAMQLLAGAKKEFSERQLKRRLRLRHPTVRLITHKSVKVMGYREAARKLKTRVKTDDVYLFGKHIGGKRGRTSENRVLLPAAMQSSVEGHPLNVCSLEVPLNMEAVLALAKREQLRLLKALRCSLGAVFWGTRFAFDLQKNPHRYVAEDRYRFKRCCDPRAFLGKRRKASVAMPANPVSAVQIVERVYWAGVPVSRADKTGVHEMSSFVYVALLAIGSVGASEPVCTADKAVSARDALVAAARALPIEPWLSFSSRIKPSEEGYFVSFTYEPSTPGRAMYVDVDRCGNVLEIHKGL